MIGAIADDLTGAAEVGAVALRHGLRAEIVVSGKTHSVADVLCADIDTRAHATPATPERTTATPAIVSGSRTPTP